MDPKEDPITDNPKEDSITEDSKDNPITEAPQKLQDLRKLLRLKKIFLTF